ncbi:MAG: hypothetical protein FD147_2430 [Chloroflexi bacterium]|nr:MAG: hypothetical protein FD147_2430 [Chloroflexota bacterium]MBA4376015.1 hypothetical protein [Anaerolinea sp.]
MGRTILSATQTWVEEEKALNRFVRALRKSDQYLIQELIALSRSHIAEASYASNLYPMDIYLVSMLLELYKKVKQLEIKLEQNGVLPVDDGPEMRGITSLLELVSRVETPSAHSGETLAETPAEPSVTKYINLQEGA